MGREASQKPVPGLGGSDQSLDSVLLGDVRPPPWRPTGSHEWSPLPPSDLSLPQAVTYRSGTSCPAERPTCRSTRSRLGPSLGGRSITPVLAECRPRALPAAEGARRRAPVLRLPTGPSSRSARSGAPVAMASRRHLRAPAAQPATPPGCRSLAPTAAGLMERLNLLSSHSFTAAAPAAWRGVRPGRV